MRRRVAVRSVGTTASKVLGKDSEIEISELKSERPCITQSAQ